MTAQISAHGRIVADVTTRTTANGNQMAMARLAVNLPCNNADEGQATYWLGVVAFGKQAEALAKHSKGDMISVSGNMQLNQWTGQDGVKKEQAQVIADSVISAKTVRPGVRKSTSNPTPKPQSNVPHEYENYPFNDEPEF